MANLAMGNDDNILGGGYGLGGFGGSGYVVLILIILFAVFGGGLWGNRRDGHGEGCGNAHGCRPTFYDESNYQEERNIDNRICGSTEKILASEASTRALIESNYIQDLRDKLTASDAKVRQLENKVYSDHEFGRVYAMLGKIEGKMLDKPPLYGDCFTPVANRVEYGCESPRRGRCEFNEAF